MGELLLVTSIFSFQASLTISPTYLSFCLFSWLEEIDRKQAEMLTLQVALEKLRYKDQLLKTENEMLKVWTLTLFYLDFPLQTSLLSYFPLLDWGSWIFHIPITSS